jgi:excisionase family DNA binding protein
MSHKDRSQSWPVERRHQADRRSFPRPGGRRATDPPADWLSITDFAARYGVHRATVYKWLSANLLHIYRVGGLTRIRNLPPDEHRAVVSASNPID